MALEVVVTRESIPVSEHTWTYKMAVAYGLATGDVNKLHQEVAHGFAEDGDALNFSDGIMASVAPQSQCTQQEVDFKHFIPLGSKVECYAMSDVTRDGNTYFFTVGIRIKGQTEPVAISKMTYGTRTAGVSKLVQVSSDGTVVPGSADVTVIPYNMHPGDVTGVAYGLEMITDADIPSIASRLDQMKGAITNLAVARASHAIWEYESEQERDAREDRKEPSLAKRLEAVELVPVYHKHEIKLYAPLGSLKIGDEIAIATDARSAASRIGKRLARGIDSVKGRPFTIEAEVTSSGRLIAKEELMLLFTPKEVIRQLIEQQQALRGA